MKYVIAWSSLGDDTEGRGQLLFSKEDAEQRVLQDNALYAGIIHHWIEPADEEKTLPDVDGER